MSKSSAYAETLHIMTSRKGNATRLRWFCEMCYESMDIEPLKLLLKTLEIIWKFPWKKNHGLKFKFENPWNKCRCLNRKKFKGLVYQRPNAESLFINHEDLRKFRGDLTLENPRGYNSRSNSISEEKETVNLKFSTMKENSGVIQDLYNIWPLKKIFRGLNSRMKRNILSLPCWHSRVKGTLRFYSTLHKLKLLGMKIRDGVVFSQYSRLNVSQ